MILSKKTIIRVSATEANIIGHMTYAASKLWNVCNYERHNYKELGLESAPTWYTQKKDYKDNIWFKSLPAQTAQEVCKVLASSWKSFYALLASDKSENPNPPRYKKDGISITYMQKGMVHKGDTVRLSISKGLCAFMRDNYNIDVQYLYLRNPCFQSIKNVKQIKLYPPENNEVRAIIVYEVPNVEPKEDNGKYLSIDLGVHNFMTCFDSSNGSSFIVGRQYLSITRKYNKEIARVQAQWSADQVKHGIELPKSSNHIIALYRKKNDCVSDYLHKITNYIACYCVEKDIHTVIIGDITGIRKDKDCGAVANQSLHALPYLKLRERLEYKLALRGISLVVQNEAYSSQCSPLSPCVSKEYARPQNRVCRGLYKDDGHSWNADTVGAYNILRLYMQGLGKGAIEAPLTPPKVIKVAV